MSISREYKIFTDDTCDLPQEYIDRFGIEIINLRYEVDGQIYAGNEMSMSEFYDRMRKGAVTKTSQASPDEIFKRFESVIKDGFDILYIAFSSGLSGTFNSACVAASDIKEAYPDAGIVVIDSLCASLGEGLLVYKACLKKQEGLSLFELAAWVEENKLHVCHNFTVDDLKYLHRGGRVSKVAAVAGTILGIKPVLHVDNAGKLIPVGKIRGRRQSIDKLVENMKACMGDGEYDNQVIAICHGDCIDDAEYAADKVRKFFGKDTKVIIGYTGTVIGAHSGPGTLAVFSMGEKR